MSFSHQVGIRLLSQPSQDDFLQQDPQESFKSIATFFSPKRKSPDTPSDTFVDKRKKLLRSSSPRRPPVMSDDDESAVQESLGSTKRQTRPIGNSKKSSPRSSLYAFKSTPKSHGTTKHKLKFETSSNDPDSSSLMDSSSDSDSEKGKGLDANKLDYQQPRKSSKFKPVPPQLSSKITLPQETEYDQILMRLVWAARCIEAGEAKLHYFPRHLWTWAIQVGVKPSNENEMEQASKFAMALLRQKGEPEDGMKAYIQDPNCPYHEYFTINSRRHLEYNAERMARDNAASIDAAN